VVRPVFFLLCVISATRGNLALQFGACLEPTLNRRFEKMERDLYLWESWRPLSGGYLMRHRRHSRCPHVSCLQHSLTFYLLLFAAAGKCHDCVDHRVMAWLGRVHARFAQSRGRLRAMSASAGAGG
jgi:hypothetical protein